MEKQISSGLRITFLVHWIITGVLGLGIWIVPGRTLTLLSLIQEWVELPKSGISIPGGAFVNPLITRLFGAALLAFAFSSFKGWRAKEWTAVKPLIQLQLVFSALGAISALYYVTHAESMMQPFGLGTLIFMAVFAVAWGYAFVRNEQRHDDKQEEISKA
jgi:hypothetical protein